LQLLGWKGCAKAVRYAGDAIAIYDRESERRGENMANSLTHFYLMVRLSKEFGREKALLLGTVHEVFGVSGGTADIERDYANNKMGASYGRMAARENYSEQEIRALSYSMLDTGALHCISDSTGTSNGHTRNGTSCAERVPK